MRIEGICIEEHYFKHEQLTINHSLLESDGLNLLELLSLVMVGLIIPLIKTETAQFMLETVTLQTQRKPSATQLPFSQILISNILTSSLYNKYARFEWTAGDCLFFLFKFVFER